MIRADAGSAEARERVAGRDRAVLRFTRDSGVYTAQSNGHANRYQLFAERALALTRRGGRIGLVLPSGLATDHGSAALRRRLLSDVRRRRARRLRQPARRLPDPPQRPVSAAHRDGRLADARHRLPARRARSRRARDGRATSTPARFAVVSRAAHARSDPPPVGRRPGDSRSPHGDGRRDRRTRGGAVSARSASERGWSARFGRELNATDDRAHFGRAGAGLPIVEGKHIEPFRVDTSRVRARHRRREGAAAARPVALRTAAARLPRRRQRDQPPDAHRGRPAAPAASRRTRCSACARRCRSRPSTSSAACSTASSSTTWSACA